MKIKYIENNFNSEILNSKGYSIVDFFAPWCGPCKMFGPVFENVSSKHENIKFYKFDTDNDIENISQNLGVMSIPTVILFKDGKEIKRSMGFLNEDDLENFINE